MNLANVDAAVKHVRQGIIGCELLRLPVVRVQLRWMEANSRRMVRRLRASPPAVRDGRQNPSANGVVHAGSADLAFNTLEWERGALAESDPGVVEPDSWTIAIDAARGEREATSEGIKKWLINRGPQTWTTLGHQTLLARVVADLELVDYADTFIGLLSPYTGCIATVGHVGELGSVAEASARLHALLGHVEQASTLLDQAEKIATWLRWSTNTAALPTASGAASRAVRRT